MSIKNIVNNYELEAELSFLVNAYPQYETFIRSNIRNFVIRNAQFVVVSEDAASFIYHFKTRLNVNPEIELIRKKYGTLPEMHHISINPMMTFEFEKVLHYLKDNQLEAKPSLNVKHLLLKVNLIEAKKNHELSILEGKTKVIMEFSNGMTWVELQDLQAFKREAGLMKSCIINYYLASQRNELRIMSLRSPKNKPLTTVEIKGNMLTQSKGFANVPSCFEKEINSLCSEYNYLKLHHESCLLTEENSFFGLDALNILLPTFAFEASIIFTQIYLFIKALFKGYED